MNLKKEVKIDWLMVLEVGIGIWFLLNMASDIQLGFGLVLIALGLNRK